MGCIVTSNNNNYSDIKLRQQIYDNIGLFIDEIEQLFELFKSYDIANNGHVTIDDLLTNLGLDDDDLNQRIFSKLDHDNLGYLQFKEFVLTLWNYCSLDDQSIVNFAFTTFDKDKDEYLSMDEVHKMLLFIFGGEYHRNFQAKIILSEMQDYINRLSPIGIDFYNFSEFVRNHQLILFKIIQVQQTLRKKVLGNDFWLNKQQLRNKLCKGKYIDITQLIGVYNHRKLSSDGTSLRSIHANKVTPLDNFIINIDTNAIPSNHASRKKSIPTIDNSILSPKSYVKLSPRDLKIQTPKKLVPLHDEVVETLQHITPRNISSPHHNILHSPIHSTVIGTRNRSDSTTNNFPTIESPIKVSYHHTYESPNQNQRRNSAAYHPPTTFSNSKSPVNNIHDEQVYRNPRRHSLQSPTSHTNPHKY